MASINLQGDTSGSISISAPSVAGTNTLTLPATTQTLATENALGVRNLIINGDMRIDQRNAGSSVANSAGAGYYLDRWQVATAQASKMNIEQNAGSVTPPDNFSNYLGMTVTSAYTAGAADYYLLAQKIEGFNASHLGFGTSNAQDITISFKVYSSLTGTFCAAIQNAAQNRTYIFNYTISSDLHSCPSFCCIVCPFMCSYSVKNRMLSFWIVMRANASEFNWSSEKSFSNVSAV